MDGGKNPSDSTKPKPKNLEISKWKDIFNKLMNNGGAVWFGAVIGWITAVTFYDKPTHDVKDLSVVVSILGGAAITKIFPKSESQFSFYCVGMAIGFFLRVFISHHLFI